jgi:hypothetical protein
MSCRRLNAAATGRSFRVATISSRNGLAAAETATHISTENQPYGPIA